MKKIPKPMVINTFDYMFDPLFADIKEDTNTKALAKYKERVILE
jgi:hypothetical protein